MQFTQETNNSFYIIRSYGPGYINLIQPLSAEFLLAVEGSDPSEINERRKLRCEQSLILTPKRLVTHWRPATVSELTVSDVQIIADLQPELVILGTGKTAQWPSRQQLAPLIERHIGVEIMDTTAACRTYNVLMHEGRIVAVAMMMI
ncbi:MAG: hypothetical protein FD130_254 [Halothiobacillaceae bacterium]|nr:MAG: hypothetical protein FD130_254 [Halothiobacillaceae bacterium]